jgi:hypothetical protein
VSAEAVAALVKQEIARVIVRRIDSTRDPIAMSRDVEERIAEGVMERLRERWRTR